MTIPWQRRFSPRTTRAMLYPVRTAKTAESRAAESPMSSPRSRAADGFIAMEVVPLAGRVTGMPERLLAPPPRKHI
jgi:hypothetical protein